MNHSKLHIAHFVEPYSRIRIVLASVVLVAVLVGLPACATPGTTPTAGRQISMPPVQLPNIPKKEYPITEFGAVEGGTERCTQAFRDAITQAVKDGGGRVVVPNGTWLTGAIHLDNNIELHLADNATLLFSQNPADYLPVVFSRHEDVECYKYSAFIYARGKHDIAITGTGTLNGQGKPWWPLKEKGLEKVLADMGERNVPVDQRVFDGTNGNALRPAFFQPMECSRILVEGVTFLYGAFWTITPTYCEDVTVRNVHIVTEGDYGHTPNGDGVDPSSTRNVLIENCEFDTGDDCIAIKAGRDRDGLRVNRPTENVVIRNCKGLRGHGGIVIGSETSGGIRNVVAENCEFTGTERMVRLKTARGRGGAMENMWFSNLRGSEIILPAIHLNMLYTGERLPAQPVTESTPMLRDIHFENITCSSGKSYAVELLGLPERSISNVTFDGVTASTAKGVHITDSDSIVFNACTFNPGSGPVFDLLDASNISVSSVKNPKPSSTFLKVDGPRSSTVTLRGCGLTDSKKEIKRSDSVSPAAVIVTAD